MRPLIVFGLGAMVGSFMNVCILRLPKGESVIWPGSRCPRCRHSIAWYENVPILSYVLLRGRCRHCHTSISAQYWVIESAAGALFVLFDFLYGVRAEGIVFLALTLALLVQAVVDARHRIIPDEITLPGLAAGLAASAFFPQLHGETAHLDGFLQSAAGALVGGGFLYLAGTLAQWALKKEAMGGGDVKLLAMVGSMIGWQGVLWTILVSSFVGSVVGLYWRWRRGDEAIPFGPYLAVGAVSYLFFGHQVVEWYIRVTMAY